LQIAFAPHPQLKETPGEIRRTQPQGWRIVAKHNIAAIRFQAVTGIPKNRSFRAAPGCAAIFDHAK
jgi:hypothetical protein